MLVKELVIMDSGNTQYTLYHTVDKSWYGGLGIICNKTEARVRFGNYTIVNFEVIAKNKVSVHIR